MTCPSQPGSMKPAVEWISRPRRPKGRLALEPCDEVVGQPDPLERRAEHELAGVEDERLLVVDLDELGQLLLRLLDVDVRIAGVVEDPEEAVDAHVDARGLDQLLVERVDLDAALVEEAANRPVGEDHAVTLAPSDRGGYGHAHEKSSSHLGAPDLRHGHRARRPPAGLLHRVVLLGSRRGRARRARVHRVPSSTAQS